jgi:hypothetical protein
MTRAAAALPDLALWRILVPLPAPHARGATAPAADRQRFLGLDLNTNGSGWTVCDARGRLLRWGVVDTSKIDCSLEVARHIRDELARVRHEFGDDVQWIVAVEDYLRVFYQRSSAKSLFALAEVNALVRYECLSIFGCKPMRIHPNNARGLFGLSARSLTAAAAAEAGDAHVAADSVPASDGQHSPQTKAGTAASVKHAVFRYVDQVLALQKQAAPRGAVTPTWLLNKRNRISQLAYDVADSALISWAALHRTHVERAMHDAEMSAKFARLIGYSEANAASGDAVPKKSRKKATIADPSPPTARKEAADSTASTSAIVSTEMRLFQKRLETLSPIALIECTDAPVTSLV